MTDLRPSIGATGEAIALYRWMWPAWRLGRLRPGLRAATASDAARWAELRLRFGGIFLPALAIALPLLLALGHLSRGGPWTYTLDVDPWTVRIYDVFTESIPFMVAAAALGMASPAAGVLLAGAYGVSDLLVTIATGELHPLLGATVGRFVSYLVLWLLVVEVPLMARLVFERISRSDDTPHPRRAIAVAVAAATVVGLVYVWGHGARILIGAVYFLTPTGLTPPPPFVVLLWYGPLVALSVGLLALPILALRFFGASAHVGRATAEPRAFLAPGSVVDHVVRLAVALLILAAFIDRPVDVAILIVGLLAAGPIARVVLVQTRSAVLLAKVPWPVRLIAGFAVAFAFARAFLGVAGIASFSRLGNMVIAVAVGFIIVEVLLAADDVADSARKTTSRPIEGLVIGGFLMLALSTTVLADNGEQAADAGAAAAVAGAAAAAAVAARRRAPRPASDVGGGGMQAEEDDDGGIRWRDAGGHPVEPAPPKPAATPPPPSVG